MSNTSYSNRKLVLAFADDFNIQSAYDVALDSADIDARHPQTTPAFHSIVPFREETRDCGGENVIVENITGKIARFTITFDATAKLIAGWFAYLQGTAAAPTGTPANETQSLSIGGATAGTYKLVFAFEGLTATSAAIAYDASNAQIQAALEEMRSIKAGNVAVTGTSPKTITFQGNLAKTNVPLITVTADTTTGGTGVAVTAGTAGDQNLHAITRTTSEQPPLFSLIEGFEGESSGTKLYRNLVVSDYTLSANRRGKVTLTVVAYGNPDYETLTGYTMPDCVTQSPIRTKDIRIKIGSDWITDDLREFTFTESNNVDVSEDALRFDDITPAQLERGDRTASINLLSLGSPTSSMFTFAQAEDTAFAAVEMHIGPPVERLSIYAPRVQFRLDDNLIEFVGTRNKSAFRLIGRPSPDLITDVVTRGDFRGSYSGQFLQT